MYGNKFKEATQSLMSYCREHMGYDNDPDVHYVTDNNNANNMLGYTAHYQPDKKVVTVYISNRHPKDVLRSLSHELVHHAQNCRGDLEDTQTEEGYAQKDPHMRKMEEEAYLKGNMMFRDWEDSCKQQNMILPSTIGENKMSEQLNNLIAEKVKTKLEEQGIQVDEGFLDKLRARAAGFTAGAGQAKKNLGALGRAGMAGLKGDKDAAKGELDKVASVGDANKTRALQSRMKGAAKSLFKVIGDIEKDLKDLGLDDDERIVGPNSAMSALKTLRTKMKNALEVLLKDATESLEQEAPVQTEETEEIEEGACPKCGMSPCACPMHEEVEDIEEEKMPDKNKDGIPDYAQDGKGSKDLGKAKGVGSDDKEEKEIEETYGNPDRGGQASKRRYNPDQDASRDTYSSADKRKAAQKKKNNAKYKAAMRAQGLLEGKEVKENELADIKKGQDSIRNLNEQRNQKLNDELMRRLLK